MKILMFGRGAIATMYGWALERAGHEVEFYVRPGRAAEYGETVSLDLIDTRTRPLGRPVKLEWPARYRETLEADHDFDLIIVSLPHTALAEAASFLAPRLGNATVLMFSNFWIEPVDVIGAIPIERMAWGFPQAGGGFGSDGVLHGGLLRAVIFGSLGEAMTDRERSARDAFLTAGFRIQERSDFRGWTWIHFASNVGFHSQGVRLGSLSGLSGNPAALRQVLLTGREFLPVVAARGIDLRRHRGELVLFTGPSWLLAPILAWMIAHVKLLRRNFEGQSNPAAGEPKAILRDALATARRLGVAVPRLEGVEQYL